jgi:hypothetical protein
VIVPLLAGAHPDFDRRVATILSQVPMQVMLAPHLGPHPLLAGALHDRLSEVGLARASRARGLNISIGSNGVLVIADRGPQAVADAGVTAVLLAARLAVPVRDRAGDQSQRTHPAQQRARRTVCRSPRRPPGRRAARGRPVRRGPRPDERRQLKVNLGSH